MLFPGLFAIVELALLVYCVLEVVTTPRDAVRGLPKPVWLVLIVLLPLIGGSAWLIAGRPRATATVPAAPPRRARPSTPDDDEAFLRSLADRAAEQRRRAEEQRRREQPGDGSSD